MIPNTCLFLASFVNCCVIANFVIFHQIKVTKHIRHPFYPNCLSAHSSVCVLIYVSICVFISPFFHLFVYTDHSVYGLVITISHSSVFVCLTVHLYKSVLRNSSTFVLHKVCKVKLIVSFYEYCSHPFSINLAEMGKILKPFVTYNGPE
jgi:hypothetical protein